MPEEFGTGQIMQILYAQSSLCSNTDERTPTEFPLCQREDDHIIKHVPEEFGTGQIMQILYAQSSFLSSLLLYAFIFS